MTYEFKEGKVLVKAVEYSVSYHCNLRCSGCSHLSPYSQKKFPSLDSFAADIDRLGKGLHAVDIRLVGGEPLLNPEIAAFIKTAKESQIADTVMVTTNGLLLHTMKDEFWKHADFVSVTLYPDALPQEKFISMFRERAEESNTRLRLYPSPIFRTTIVTEPQLPDWITSMIFKTCKTAHLYHCHMIHEGMLYKCAVPPFLPGYLSKVGQDNYNPSVDAFNIHGASEMYQDVKEFLVSPEPLDACRFCLGHVGKFQEHHQLKLGQIADPGAQHISRRTHLDSYKFVKECVRYCRRRALEKITGKQSW
jgi:hypothetical protein